jgi:hypothetical protein
VPPCRPLAERLAVDAVQAGGHRLDQFFPLRLVRMRHLFEPCLETAARAGVDAERGGGARQQTQDLFREIRHQRIQAVICSTGGACRRRQGRQG